MMRNFGIIAALTLAALTSTAALAEAPTELNFCTGGEGGFYESLGAEIGKSIVKGTEINLNVINTGGSIENAEMLKDGDCDIAILQADAAKNLPLPSDIKVVDAHREVVYWIFGKNGIDDFADMENDDVAKKYSFATVTGSGSMVTLGNWITTDKDYAGAVPIEFDDWYSAAEAVAQGYVKRAGVTIEIAGMLYIGRAGKISSDILEDFGSQVKLGEINDGSFANYKDLNDNPMYTQCEVGPKETSGLKTSTISTPDVYCLRAQVVYNNDWHKDAGGKEGKKLARAVAKGINSTVKAVR